jgi:hypothetical protein
VNTCRNAAGPCSAFSEQGCAERLAVEGEAEGIILSAGYEASQCEVAQGCTARSESRCAPIKLLEVMSTSVYTGLTPFNFILKYFQ